MNWSRSTLTFWCTFFSGRLHTNPSRGLKHNFAFFLSPRLSVGVFDFWRLNFSFRYVVENETRCYGEIGCLNITREWYHLIHRPFNVFPLPRNVINTKFILYSEENPNEGQMLIAEDKESINNSNFRADRQTKFIIHGFIDTPLSNWVSELKNELLEHSRQNNIGMSVIVVDWAGGSLPLYTQATANTRLVGLELAYLIKKLRDEHGLRPEDVHLIGHSLGAHLAAYAAERVPNIGRITALDPAEPYFQGMPNQVRLDTSDALVSFFKTTRLISQLNTLVYSLSTSFILMHGAFSCWRFPAMECHKPVDTSTSILITERSSPAVRCHKRAARLFRWL